MSNIKIVHIMPDDKFNNIAIRQFESVAPSIHEYWILTDSKNITHTTNIMVKIVSTAQIKYELISKEISAVFFHSLQPAWYQLLENIPYGVKVFWFGWGCDYYFMLPHKLFLNKTFSHIRPTLNSKAKYVLKKYLRRVSLLVLPRYKALRRVDYFSPVLDVEFQMVTKNMPYLSSARYICWNYGTAEDDLSIDGATQVTGNNILAGNSASATNNHMELFYTIKEQVNLEGRSVIVPLSYGDVKYRDMILEKGKKILGKHFVPITEFMPKDRYIKKLQSCGFVAMNHLRQQAFGNICIAMLMGAKVYLNAKNPLYGWLHKRGATLGNLTNLDMVSLSGCQREFNQKIVCDHLGREPQASKTRNVIAAALGNGALV